MHSAHIVGGQEEEEVYGHLWQFGNCEFDEFSRELRVNGRPVEMEAKPLEVLYQLLLHPGEVVTKEELLESVWSGVRVVDGSLATAVSKLRKTIGDDPPIVLTIPRVGYRLGVPARRSRVTTPAPPESRLKPGDPVPGRDQWQLLRNLDPSSSSDVWLAEHPKTRETRVFKFASDGIRLRSLKREVTLARLLKDSLGERSDFVRILEWNFDAPPFYFESEYCGLNFAEWAESQGGLERIPFQTRLRLFLETAQAVAAAHETGVLHKDLKPANVMIAPAGEGRWQIKVVDFGSGSLLQPGRLNALGITNLGFTQTASLDSLAVMTGTLMYMAPEVLAGQPPTASADVYALGVMLYQLATGDFRRPLSAGWETTVDDPLIREDIADAACGDPAKRLATVAALVDRLQTLDARRTARTELDLAKARAHRVERRLEAARARRPWVLAAVAILVIGLGVSLELYRRASSERDRANRQTNAAAAMNRFLASDLLGRGDPFQSGTSTETLVDAVKQASPRIDRQFSDAPEIAAQLHHEIARALDNRTDWPDARHEYESAAELFLRTGGPLSQDAITVRLQRAMMEARTYETGSLPLARSILAQQESLLAKISRPREDVPVWLHSARGMIALIGNNAKLAAEEFGTAYRDAASLATFDESTRLTLKQRLAFAHIRLGDGAGAERLIRELIADFSRINGADSPQVLRVRLNLAQAFMIQGKNKEAIQETTSLYPAYVARLGETHELSMQLLTTRAQCEGTLGIWNDAIRDDLAIYRLAIQKQGPLSFFAIGTLADASLAQCRSGRYTEGVPNARKAWESSVRAFGAHAGLTGGAAYSLASCWIGTGRLQDAASLLREIDTKAVAELAGFPDWSANVTLAQGEIALRQGNDDDAQRYMEAAKPVFMRADAEPYQRRAVETLSAAIVKRASAGKK